MEIDEENNKENLIPNQEYLLKWSSLDNNGQINSSDCNFDNINQTNYPNNSYYYQTSILFTTVSGKKFAYFFARSNSWINWYNLVKCNVKIGNSDNSITNDGQLYSCTQVLGTENPRGLSIWSKNGQQYLYFTDNQDNTAMYRSQIYDDGNIEGPRNILSAGTTLPVGSEQIYFSSVNAPTTLQYDTQNWSNGGFSMLPGYIGYQKLIMMG